jgi:four helix bundle protein
MARFTRFEDIEAWQEAKTLAAEIYKLTNHSTFRRDFSLKDQIRRAAVSVMANIAEGFGRKTNKDFANFLYTARASAMEVISHAYIAQELNYINDHQFDPLRTGYERVIAKTTKLIRYLETTTKPKRTTN